MGNKRGSHVGMIASFAIFVLFLIGIYLAVEPAFKTGNDKKLLLEYTKSGLLNEFSSNLTTVIIKPAGNCSIISNSLAEVPNGYYAIVKDENGNVVGSNFSGNNLAVNTYNGALWIYYSDTPFISSTSSDIGCVAPPIESIRDNKEIFENKILNGISNFESLKTSLKIPTGSEFSLGFEYSNGTRISSFEKNVSSEVYAEEIYIRYVDKNANNLPGKLIIKTW